MFYLRRRIYFSAAHMYWVSQWSADENIRHFGLCSNQNGHGHDYQVDITIKGKMNPETGLVVNITEIDQIASDFIETQLDGKFLNHDQLYFQDKVPTTENLAEFIWQGLDGKIPDVELQRINVRENPFLFSSKEVGSLLQLTRRYHFSAAHRLHNDGLSDQENERLFGKCNNLHGHGHNYYLEVTVAGAPDPVTGMIIDLNHMDETVKSEVLEKWDHKHLNMDTDEFKQLNPTGEAIAMVAWELLAPYFPNLQKIGLWETEKNYYEYIG